MPGVRSLAHVNIDKDRKALARAVCQGQDVREAAKAIGFTRDALDATLSHPAFTLAIRVEIMQRLNTVTAPQAINILSDLMKDKNVLPHVRRQAASDLLDRAGIIAPKAESAKNGSETALLSDMSTAALQALVHRLETELSDRAKPVINQPGQV